VDLFQFAPVPGLAGAAHTLLKIWDAVGLVSVSIFCRRLSIGSWFIFDREFDRDFPAVLNPFVFFVVRSLF
jgi:hypothetical protein